MKMNADIFILARLDSSRLSNKHLLEIDGVPIINVLVNRLKDCTKIRHIIVCTTDLPSDEPLVKLCEREKIKYFRGNNEDVLQRFLDCATHFGTDIIVDVEGDKIYTDPKFVDSIVEQMEEEGMDFLTGGTSDKFDPTDHFIHGIIPAGIKTSILKKICDLKITKNTETGYKEFFTRYDFINYKFIILNSKISYSKNIRLTLDYAEDYNLAKIIFKKLGNKFGFEDIIKLFKKNSELEKITKGLVEKWEGKYNEKITDFSLKKVPDF